MLEEMQPNQKSKGTDLKNKKGSVSA